MTGEVSAEGAAADLGFAAPYASGGNRNHREIDHRVAQPGSRSRHRNRHEVIVPHAIPELRHHDRDLDGLAVLVAGVEVERVRE